MLKYEFVGDIVLMVDERSLNDVQQKGGKRNLWGIWTSQCSKTEIFSTYYNFYV